MRMTTKRSLIVFTVTTLLLVGGAVFARSTPAAPAKAAARPSVAVGKSIYGRILFDGRGYALYAFTSDPRGRATCYGACAKGWPPYIVKARPAAGKGTSAGLIGITRRRDGRLQATYAGRPLYFYVGDNAPGIVLCQNVNEYGGLWLVIRASGAPVR
jgi:predicted lipoprotein with Yx(FWY)xxD motif